MTPWEPLRHRWTRSTLWSFLTLTFILSLLSSVRAQYFIIDQPSGPTSWANGSPYPLKWTKGLLDGVDFFDVELTRLRKDGLILIAKNVPSTYNALNILLQDVPEGDDYFVVCFSSSNSIIYSLSSRFTITNSSSGQSNPSPDPSAPTVTASGVANPLKGFAATLGASANSGSSLIFPGPTSPNTGALGLGGILVLFAAFLGGAMTLW